MSFIEWNNLLDAPSFCPMSDLGLEASEEEICRQLMNVAPCQYIIVTPFNNLISGVTEGSEGFFAGFFWAASEDAMSRIFDNKIEEDEQKPVTKNPPSELLLGATGPTFKEIFDASRLVSEDVMVSEKYRIAIDGLFVCKKITVNEYTFFFREEEEKGDDIVIAIQYNKN